MKLIIKKDYESICQVAVNIFLNRLKQFEENSSPIAKQFFVVGLPTGSTPLQFYKGLVKVHQEHGVSFKNVVTFNMDEYVGIAENHPESYHSYMFNNFFNHIDIDTANIHILNGNSIDKELECNKYEQKIINYGGIDLFVGGLGENGHIAFNEPGSNFLSRTRLQKLTKNTIQANARFFNNNMDLVPKEALTVGIQTIADALEILVLINGNHKAFALQQVIEGNVSEICPASALQLHANITFIVDENAVTKLNIETIRRLTQQQAL